MAHAAPGDVQRSVVPKTSDVNAGAWNAYTLLHLGFTLLPIVVGADKFFGMLANWDKYLSPNIPATLGITAHQFMMGVGVAEIIVGMIVAFKPRIGAYLVALWLAGVIGNLVMNPTPYWDVAARDVGLIIGALSLGSLTAWSDRVHAKADKEPTA